MTREDDPFPALLFSKEQDRGSSCDDIDVFVLGCVCDSTFHLGSYNLHVISFTALYIFP